MAYPGTLPPEASRDAATIRASQRAATTPSDVKTDDQQGAAVFYLLLLFTFFLLGRPQDFVRSIRGIPTLMPIGISAFLLWLLGLCTGQIKFRKSRELNLVMGLTAWFILGIPFAYWRPNSLDVLRGDWAKTVMLFVLLTQTLTNQKRVRQLLWVIFLSCLVATTASLVMRDEVMARISNENARFMGVTRGFFGGNYLGIGASVTLPFMAVMLIHSRSILKQLFLVTTFGTLVFMVVLTVSRSNLLSIVLSLILVWVTILRESMKAKLIGVIFVIGLVMALAFAPRNFWERVGTLWHSGGDTESVVSESAEASEIQRKMLFLRSLRLTATHPIFGVGMGNFEVISGVETGESGAWKGTHNTFTQISSEAGIPALVMFLMLLMTGITRMRRVVRGCKGKPKLALEGALASATVVSLLSFMFGAWFAHVGYDYYLYYLAGISVGVQAAFVQATGQSLEDPAGGPERKNGNVWGRFRRPLRGART